MGSLRLELKNTLLNTTRNNILQMKLISFLAVLPSAFGADIHGINDVFAYYFPEAGFPGLSTHGCHCRGVAGNGGFNAQPLDQVDANCKNFNDAVHCVYLEDGPCHGIEDTVINTDISCVEYNDGSAG